MAGVLLAPFLGRWDWHRFWMVRAYATPLANYSNVTLRDMYFSTDSVVEILQWKIAKLKMSNLHITRTHSYPWARRRNKCIKASA
jgi:hypothetical protein